MAFNDNDMFPGHYEQKLDKRTGEIFEEFIPDDKYEYVITGHCKEKNDCLYIDAVLPGEGKNGRCDGTFYGFVSKEKIPPHNLVISLYPHSRSGNGMHEKLFAKRKIPAHRAVTKRYYNERYGTYSFY